MKRVSWIFVIAVLFFACNNNESNVQVSTSVKQKDGQVKSKISSGNMSTEELRAAAQERQEQRKKEEEERIANQTTMEILPSDYDFGQIPKEVPVTTIFKLKNTGDKPLIINDAQASCGCTVPRKPEEPILPGEEGELEVTFTSNPSQAGTAIDKRITVRANIPGGEMYCTIRGKVNP